MTKQRNAKNSPGARHSRRKRHLHANRRNFSASRAEYWTGNWNAELTERINTKELMDASTTFRFSTFLRHKLNHSAGFTHVELLAVLLGIALLTIIVFPVLAASPANSQRPQCFNNLRQIGRGLRVWGNDHWDQPPWLTAVSAGGTAPDSGGKPANAWFEYLAVSNELSTPRILACPADESAKVASQWSGGSDALASATLRANAISYAIGAHSFTEFPRAFLAADRNIMVSYPSTTCQPTRTTGISGLRVLPDIDASIGWTNAVHRIGGHLLLNDGSVEFTDSARLRDAISDPAADRYATLHIFKAR